MYAEAVEANGPENGDDALDVEAVEAEKAALEMQYMEDGELVKTNVELDRVGYHRNIYDRERLRMMTQRKERRLTGQDWEQRTDGTTGMPFWYNVDTGEALWETPPVLVRSAAERAARRIGFGGLPTALLVRVALFLAPYPDRNARMGATSRRWLDAAHHQIHRLRVLPAEAVAAR